MITPTESVNPESSRLVHRRQIDNRRETRKAKLKTLKRCPHAPRAVPSRCKVPVSKLSVRVATPAHSPPVAHKSTRVTLPSRHAHNRPPTKINTRKTVAHLASPVATRQRVSKTKLTISIVSPALGSAVVKHNTRVVVAAGYRHSGTTHSQIHRRKSVPHVARLATAPYRVPKPKLPVPVVAPTLGRAIR